MSWHTDNRTWNRIVFKSCGRFHLFALKSVTRVVMWPCHVTGFGIDKVECFSWQKTMSTYPLMWCEKLWICRISSIVLGLVFRLTSVNGQRTGMNLRNLHIYIYIYTLMTRERFAIKLHCITALYFWMYIAHLLGLNVRNGQAIGVETNTRCCSVNLMIRCRVIVPYSASLVETWERLCKRFQLGIWD